MFLSKVGYLWSYYKFVCQLICLAVVINVFHKFYKCFLKSIDIQVSTCNKQIRSMTLRKKNVLVCSLLSKGIFPLTSYLENCSYVHR